MKRAVVTLIVVALFGLSWHSIPSAHAQTISGPEAQSLNRLGAACPGFLPSRLAINTQGRVTPGLPNRLRDNPSATARVLATIPGGGVFTVLNGPTCDPAGAAWWQVNYNNTIGWTMEGQGNTYWTEPYGSGCLLSPRLIVGNTAQVTIGLPNKLRSGPGATAAEIGKIPGGEYVSVVGGPQCVSSLWYWQVNYKGMVGWTAEGQTSTYWLIPLTCPNSPPSLLMPAMQAYVTPGLPNALRSQPGTGTVIVYIPAGAAITVISGPQCGGDGRLWWQVNYNGTTGWTAEGDGATYWLAPSGSSNTGCMTARLAPGLTGQVTPGLPNSLRTQPGAGSVTGQIPAGAYFKIISGPQCVGGINWWQVQYGTLSGWTGEGQNGVYWLTPVVCSASPASRLMPGMEARVTPGLPNSLNSRPGPGSGFAQIPAGTAVPIIGGPQCGSDGRLWWQVNYGGLIGWTAEGDGGTYWLEPVS